MASAASGGGDVSPPTPKKAPLPHTDFAAAEDESCVYSRGLLLMLMEKAGSHFTRSTSVGSTEAAESSSTPGTPNSAPDSGERSRAQSIIDQLPARLLPRALPADPEPEAPGNARKKRTRSSSDGKAVVKGKPNANATARPTEEATQSAKGVTTVMLRNIPNQYTRDNLCKRMDELGFKGKYDFVYLPGDRASDRNMGYAFLNLKSSDDFEKFMEVFNGKPVGDCLPGSRSVKVCEVRPAEVQGRQENFDKWCQTGGCELFTGREQWQPLFLDEEGKTVTLSTNKLRQSRRRRRVASGMASGATDSNASSVFDPEACPMWLPYLMPPEWFMQPSLPAYAGPAFLPPPRPVKAPSAETAIKEPAPAKQLRAEAPEFTPEKPQPPSSAPTNSSAGAMAQPPKKKVAPATAVARARAALEARAEAESAQREQMKASERSDWLQMQLEYYFSVQNLSTDFYLRSLMDHRGWVKVSDLVSFPRLRQHDVTGAEVVAALVSRSAQLSVSKEEGERRVRLTYAGLRNQFPRMDSAEACSAPTPATKKKNGHASTKSSKASELASAAVNGGAALCIDEDTRKRSEDELEMSLRNEL